jgi:hypothetical protein
MLSILALLATETIKGVDSIREFIIIAKTAIKGSITSIIATIMDKVSNLR